jgi:predicted nucleic acid-binding protein
VVVGDIILIEVLPGPERYTAYRAANTLLLELDVRTIGGVELAVKSADNFGVLRKNGVTVRKTVDCPIAIWCIEHRIPLLHNDPDIDPFVRHLRRRFGLAPG